MPGALTPATQNVERDAESIRAYALNHPEATAYIACEYPLGVLAHRVLTTLDRCVPGDYAVVCFDAPHSPLDDVIITYVEQDEEAMGIEAVAMLLAQIAGREVPLHVVTRHKLVHGPTT